MKFNLASNKSSLLVKFLHIGDVLTNMNNAVKYENIIFKRANEWLKYIDNLPRPQNDIDRVHNQYKAMQFITKLTVKYENLYYDLFSILCFPFSILSSALSTAFSKFFRSSIKCDCVRIFDINENFNLHKKIELPKEIEIEFKKTENYYVHKRVLIFTGILTIYSLKLWLKALIRHPFSFYENFSIFIHLNFINKIFLRYNTKAIITLESENDFTTSLLSNLCEHYNAEYIGIMHGENFVNPLHTNVRFSRFYVWDKHYIKQYIRTGSPEDMFFTYTPKRYKMNLKYENLKNSTYLTYYLQGQDETILKNIRNVLVSISRYGKKCKIRVHPRATDIKLVKKIFMNTDIEIEDYNSISIEKSYSSTKYIVSTFSTVLSEAFENGLYAVLDDITDKNTYNVLKQLMYINIERVPLRLSEILEKSDKANNE